MLRTKGDLGSLLGLSSFDYALPQDWVDKVKTMGIDPVPFYVWSYDTPGSTVFGKPLNLAEEFYRQKAEEYDKAISALRYLLDFITSGERYKERNPYTLPEVKMALEVVESYNL